MHTLFRDLKYSLRVLRRSPGFTFVAVLLLALGIGANTAIFSLTRAVLLRNLPVAEPDRLMLLSMSRPGQELGLSGPLYRAISKRQQVYSSVFAWHGGEIELNENGSFLNIPEASVTGNGLATLGLKPALGRLLTPDDDHQGGGANGWVADISYEFWQDHFNGDRGVIGRSLDLAGIAVTVVGVTPQGFSGVEVGESPKVILPLEFERQWKGDTAGLDQPAFLMLTVMGRLNPGVTPAQARADLERIKAGAAREADPQNFLGRFFSQLKLQVASGSGGRSSLRIQYREPLLVLQTLVGLVLVICCSNLAMLLFARGSARRHEVAIRTALGARRGTVVRQLFVETLLVSIAGAVLGGLLSGLASATLLKSLTATEPLTLDVAPDLQVFLFTAAVAIGTALISGILPALRTSRVDVSSRLKQGMGSRDRESTRSERWLLGGQVAFSMMLLIVAGLFSGTLYRLMSMDPGFRKQATLIVPTDFSKVAQKPDAINAVYLRMLDRLTSAPGVESATVEAMPTLKGWRSSMSLAPVTPTGLGKPASISYNAVGADYFRTRGTPILAGRDISTQDSPSGQPVCVLNESASHLLFAGQNALGKLLQDSSPGLSHPATYVVVGVVRDSKFTSLRAPAQPTAYIPFVQFFQASTSMDFVLHTNSTREAIGSYRQILHEFAPFAPFLTPVTMQEQLNASIGQDITLGMLAGFFAVLALILTAVGLYGLLSFSVNSRTREIGIRVALGAERKAIYKNVIREAVLPVLAGLACGTAGALASARFVASLLYGTRPWDPSVFAASVAMMLGIAAFAAWLPARRAAHTDPLVALRYE